jgi:hypothetical protein
MANLANDGQYFENRELSTELHFSVREYGAIVDLSASFARLGRRGVCPYAFAKS